MALGLSLQRLPAVPILRMVGVSPYHVWLTGTVHAADLARPHPGGTPLIPDMGPTLP
jgi:hypothetical protein